MSNPYTWNILVWEVCMNSIIFYSLGIMCGSVLLSSSFHAYDTSALGGSVWDFIFFHPLWLCADWYCIQTAPLHRTFGS